MYFNIYIVTMNICSNNLKTNNNCFNKKSLIKIIKKYNEEYLNDKIENYNNKNYTELYDLLNMKIINNTKCKDQTCWVKLDFINKLNDKYINNLENIDNIIKIINTKPDLEYLDTLISEDNFNDTYIEKYSND